MDEPSTSYPPGAATRQNTFKCISSQSGALEPMFRLVTYYNGVDYNGGAPQGGGSYVVDGFYAAGPLIPTGMDVTVSDRPHELWLGVEYTTDTQRIHNLERLLVDELPFTRETIITKTVADTTQALNGWGMTFAATRANQEFPEKPGIPIVVAAWSPPFTGVGGYAITFPHSTTPTSNTPFDILSEGAPGGDGDNLLNQQVLVVCHQNRIILRRETTYGHGVDQIWATTEDLFHTDANNPAIYNGPQAFVPENPDGYGVMAAMSASELFAVKQSGGLFIQGDIENPHVRNLPMVTGGGDGGAYTRMGFMYGGSSTGLWVWPHGDTSDHLSQLLEPDFYQIPDEVPLVAQRYQWDCADNYVFLSYNWVYDTDVKSFWRLDDPDLYQFRWMAHRLQWLYGAVDRYEADALTCIYSYDMTKAATSFKWQSHPLWSTIDRTVDIRDVSVRASGTGTVTITLSALGVTPKSQVFEFSSDIPFLQRQAFSIRGQAMTVLIESQGADDGDAPTVYEINLQPSDRAAIPSVT